MGDADTGFCYRKEEKTVSKFRKQTNPPPEKDTSWSKSCELTEGLLSYALCQGLFMFSLKPSQQSCDVGIITSLIF